MKRRVKWSVSVLATAAVAIGCVWWGTNATPVEAGQNAKPISFESKAYNMTPEPVMKSNKGKIEQLESKQDAILKKVKLAEHDKIKSVGMKTWGDYNTTEGERTKNFEVEDDRLVWVIQIDCPDGLQTRGGFYRNATAIYVVDADSEKLIETRVHGDLDPKTEPFNNPIISVDKQ